MDKTSLDKVIDRRAEKRFETEFENLLGIIGKHPVGKYLKVKIGDDELKLAMDYRGGAPTGALLDPYPSKSVTENTNYDEVKERLLKEYRDQELRDILNKLDGIQYLFEQA